MDSGNGLIISNAVTLLFLLGVTQAAVDVRDRFPLNPTVQVGAACRAALALQTRPAGRHLQFKRSRTCAESDA